MFGLQRASARRLSSGPHRPVVGCWRRQHRQLHRHVPKLPRKKNPTGEHRSARKGKGRSRHVRQSGRRLCFPHHGQVHAVQSYPACFFGAQRVPGDRDAAPSRARAAQPAVAIRVCLQVCYPFPLPDTVTTSCMAAFASTARSSLINVCRISKAWETSAAERVASHNPS